MSRQAAFVWALVSAAVMVIGAFGPWVTAMGVISVSGTTFSKHPYAIAGMAVAAALLMFTRRASASGGGWAALFGACGAGLGLYDHHHLTTALGGSSEVGQAFAKALIHVGWGLDAAIAGSISLLLSGIAWVVFTADPDELQVASAAEAAASPSTPTVPAGWYRDPNDDAMLRYWNGFGWTTQTAKPAS